MIKKQAEIRRSGRGTFSRARAGKRNGARWTHIRYKGSINLQPGPSQAVEGRDQVTGSRRRSAIVVIVSRLARSAFRRAFVGSEHQVRKTRSQLIAMRTPAC
jgi:hypothetical protein